MDSANERAFLCDLRAAMSKLPTKHRRIAELLLRGENIKTIAEGLDMTRNNVYVQVHRMRRKLAELLDVPNR